TLSPGLAAGLVANPNADPDQGGSLDRLRDGGIGDPSQPAYGYNPTGASAFEGRLQEIVDAFGRERAFDPSLGATASADLLGFASASVGWLESSRQGAASEIDYRNALLARSTEALSNATGVNIDEEMTIMLELERSYQASAKLIATVDSMFATLLDAVR
ncbi:MAG TPA: flagellar basal body rod C-terminal domain-containing protein, partial [Paracoccaceae bacterium]|nr:flagellar basal body rod C-terminal domain-containing protein [Paracoccaceae bacterium]